jgi:iron complex outermembrane receptor protein
VVANWRMNEDWTFKYVLAKRESDTETNIDFDTTPDKIADVKAFYSDEQVTNEFQANYDAGGRSRGVIGIYKFDGEAGGQVLNNFFNLSFGDTQGTVYTKSIAAYADWTFDVSDKFSWTRACAGPTRTSTRWSGTSATPMAPSPSPAAWWRRFDKTINFKNLSPKISLDYQITPDIMVYGLASRGFKSGGYNIRAQATAVPRSAEPFQDEQVDSFEVGTKMAPARPAPVPEPVGVPQQVQGHPALDLHRVHHAAEHQGVLRRLHQRRRGHGQRVRSRIPVAADRQLQHQRQPGLAGCEVRRVHVQGVNIADQQEFTNAPDFSGALNVEYRIDLANGGSLSARVGYTYQSRVVARPKWSRTDPGTVQPITQDGYGLVGAGRDLEGQRCVDRVRCRAAT